MADWQTIKTEYITTQTSYRKLGEKYGVNYKVIADRGKDEGWRELRSQYKEKTLTNTLDKISRQEANRAARIYAVADKLLDKIEDMVECGSLLNSQGVRALTAAVKDLKEIQGIRSSLDTQEQEARIANLRKQADREDDTVNELEVIFSAGPEEWNE